MLLLGPGPSAVGGIATIVRDIREADRVGEFDFFDTAKGAKSSGGKAAGALSILSRLSSKLLTTKPSVMMTFSSAGASFWEKTAWVQTARICGVPSVVMMVDGNFPTFYEGLQALLKGAVRRSLESMSTVIVQSESWRAFYHGIAPKARLAVVPNGIRPERFASIERSPRDAREVLYVGWLIPEKGIVEMIRAMALLKRRGLGLTLRLVGPDHGNLPMVRDAIVANDVEDCVHVAGVASSPQALTEFFAAADIFVLPSYAEGLPSALLEAMAAGLPPIATCVGGIPDVIENGISGILVNPKDDQALAEAISRLARDTRLAAAMGKAAAARVRASFTVSHFLAGVREVLGVSNEAA